MTRHLLFIIALTFAAVSHAQQPGYLNNPSTGITTYDKLSCRKLLPSAPQDFLLATRFQYVYLSDVLNERCIDNRGKVNKMEIARGVKDYFDKHLDFSKKQRYNLRIFPEYNGTEPCRNASVINAPSADDGKLLINYPVSLFNRLSKQKFPPCVIKAVFPENYKQTKNIALLDMRNSLVRQLYDAVLEAFASYLEETADAPRLLSATNAPTTCRKGDFIARIEMGFVGPWGEGMTKYQHGSFDAASLTAVAEMYKKHLHGYIICAPSFGMRTSTTIDKSLYAFEYYLLTTTYGTLKKENGLFTGSKEFGLFIDHLGSDDSKNDFLMSHAGKDFLPIALRKYRTAPVIGENSGRFAKEDVMRDVQRFGVSLCNAWTSVKPDNIPDSSLQQWRNAASYFGYRFYYARSRTTLLNGVLRLSFLVGNRSYSPLYDDFWLPQVVVRDKDGRELKVIDIDDCLNPKSLPCLKSALNYEAVVEAGKQAGVAVPAGSKVYLRIIDRHHINENMYLDNAGRTPQGEYPL